MSRAVLAPADESTLIAAMNRGVFRTTDAGRTWAEIGGDWLDRFADQVVNGLAVI